MTEIWHLELAIECPKCRSINTQTLFKNYVEQKQYVSRGSIASSVQLNLLLQSFQSFSLIMLMQARLGMAPLW